MKDEIELLHEASYYIVEAMGIELPVEPVVPSDDSRVEAIEHVCHELSHALLLDLPLFEGELSARIEGEIRLMSVEEANLNEAEAFVIERAVLPHLGISIDESDLEHALGVQIGSYTNSGAWSVWESDIRSEKVRGAICRIPKIWNTYKEQCSEGRD